MSTSSSYYGVQVRCPLLRRTVRRCCCPPCYIKRYSTALCFAFIHTWDMQARRERRGFPSQPLCVTLSLVCLFFSHSGEFTIRWFVLFLSLSLFNFLSLSLTYVRELLPLFAHISSFFFASSISPLQERCLIQAAVYLAVS